MLNSRQQPACQPSSSQTACRPSPRLLSTVCSSLSCGPYHSSLARPGQTQQLSTQHSGQLLLSQLQAGHRSAHGQHGSAPAAAAHDDHPLHGSELAVTNLQQQRRHQQQQQPPGQQGGASQPAGQSQVRGASQPRGRGRHDQHSRQRAPVAGTSVSQATEAAAVPVWEGAAAQAAPGRARQPAGQPCKPGLLTAEQQKEFMRQKAAARREASSVAHGLPQALQCVVSRAASLAVSTDRTGSDTGPACCSSASSLTYQAQQQLGLTGMGCSQGGAEPGLGLSQPLPAEHRDRCDCPPAPLCVSLYLTRPVPSLPLSSHWQRHGTFSLTLQDAQQAAAGPRRQAAAISIWTPLAGLPNSCSSSCSGAPASCVPCHC